MPIRINLDSLAYYFRTDSATMPSILRQFWNFLQLQASTPQQKSILSDFESNPSSQNQARVITMLRSAVTQTKRSGTKHGFSSDSSKAEHSKFFYTVYGESFKFRYAGRFMGGNKTTGATPRGGSGGTAKKAAPKKAAKRAAPNKKSAPPKKAKRLDKIDTKHGASTKIFTRVSVNKQLVLKKAEKVNVMISRERLQTEKGQLSAVTSALISENKKLRVQIKPVLNCKANGPHTFSIAIPRDNNPAEVVFSIVGTHTGKAAFSVDVWQGYELAATLLFNVIVVVKKASTETTAIRVVNNPTGNITKTVNQLRINQQQNGNRSTYGYEVSFASINQWLDYQSPVLNANTTSYISALYKKIEQLHIDAAGDAKEFDNKLKTYGADLFLTLFPPELQKLLYDNCSKLNSIQIISNEPHIPWEILVIRDPDKTKPTRLSDPFFGELGIIRWIKVAGFPGEKLQCRAAKSKFVIPAYHHEKRVLPMAGKETSLLTETFKAARVPATVQAVKALLRSGDFDLLHFCCHGEGENTNIIGARLVMEEIKERGNWKPTYVEQLFVEQCGTFIRNKSPQPIIVLNGCRTGILGKKIAGYGGFAKAFIQAGAGVFVGGLWAVEDSAAYNFISAFYMSLKKGKDLSHATIEARNKSKGANNTTWLAYVVYGNPFAKLV